MQSVLLPPALRAEVARRYRARVGNPKAYLRALHPKQETFVLDRSPKKAALCSRRAGKTEGVAAWLLDAAEDDPCGLSVYVALTRNNARLILWSTLEEISRRHGLGLALREIDGQLMVELQNRHRIWLAGCKDSSEIEKFRGPKYRRAAIDEAASYGSYLRTLVDDVLEPALLDKNGELCLVGTPGAIPLGLFYEATTGDGGPKWSTHSWTVLDNPYIPHAAEWLARKRAANQWSEDNPTYQREWLGRWMLDTGALVYPYDSLRNVFWSLPDDDGSDWVYGIGVDVGFEDSTAWVIGAFRRSSPEMYLIKTVKQSHLIPSAVAAKTQQFMQEFGARHVVVDEGGFGKGYAEEMRKRYGLFVQPAEKTKKRAYQEIVAGEFRNGNIKINPVECADLLDEITVLQWDEKRIAESENQQNHAADAMLYLVRSMRTFYKSERDAPEVGSREWHEKERAKRMELAKQRVRRQVRRKLRER